MESIAPQSQHIEKNREKLKKQFEERDKLVTPEAIRKCWEQIHAEIAKYQGERCEVRGKEMSLFNDNQNSARSTMKPVMECAERVGYSHFSSR